MDDPRLFRIIDNKGDTQAGLEGIPANHSAFQRLALDKPLDSLEVGQRTRANWFREWYEVVRVK